MCVTSDDRGRTWSERKPVTPAQECRSAWDPSWRCPRITALSDGRLAVIVDRVSTPRQNGAIPGEQSNWICISNDSGETWDLPRKTPVTGSLPDHIVELSSGPHAGRWLTTTHATMGNGSRHWMQQAWISENRGHTWEGPFVIADEPGLKLCEGSVMPLPGGELVCFLRNESGKDGETFRTVSRDGGITWGEVVSFPLPGCYRPRGQVLRSGRVMIAYRFRQATRTANPHPENLFVALTDVDSCLGAPEDAQVRIMPLDYDRSARPDLGYSGWVQFPDGGICVVNHIVDNAPAAHVRGYHFRESDFVLPGPEPAPAVVSRNGSGSGTPFPVTPRSGFVSPRSGTVAPFPVRPSTENPFPGPPAGGSRPAFV